MLTAEQFKNARLLLAVTQVELAGMLGVNSRCIIRIETGKRTCRKSMALAVRFLLVEAGLYVHFRMLFMRKDKKIEAVKLNRAERKRYKERAIVDALGFKYDK
jgi:DNA-binding XRE family transcriptional regulator